MNVHLLFLCKGKYITSIIHVSKRAFVVRVCKYKLQNLLKNSNYKKKNLKNDKIFFIIPNKILCLKNTKTSEERSKKKKYIFKITILSVFYDINKNFIYSQKKKIEGKMKRKIIKNKAIEKNNYYSPN